jgi:hypothetical protein
LPSARAAARPRPYISSQFPLKLRKSGEDAEHEPTVGRADIQTFVQTDEVDPHGARTAKITSRPGLALFHGRSSIRVMNGCFLFWKERLAAPGGNLEGVPKVFPKAVQRREEKLKLNP